MIPLAQSTITPYDDAFDAIVYLESLHPPVTTANEISLGLMNLSD